MSDNRNASNKCPLRDEPLPVCIHSSVRKFPSYWCFNDNRTHPADPIPPYEDIAEMESYLADFVRVTQGVVLHIVSPLKQDNSTFILLNGHRLHFQDFLHIVKYGSRKHQELQEAALALIADVAKQAGFTLGEFKALIYVASRDGSPYYAVLSDEAERKELRSWKCLVGARWFGWDAVEYKWGGNLKQFKPILQKMVDYYENVVIPSARMDETK